VADPDLSAALTKRENTVRAERPEHESNFQSNLRLDLRPSRILAITARTAFGERPNLQITASRNDRERAFSDGQMLAPAARF
jgi:hypothetical protein